MAFNLSAIQAAIGSADLDGWLFYDFRRSNAVAHRVLDRSPHAFFTRRWCYYVPAHGQPVALTSAVEAHVLDGLPGTHLVYHTWQEYRQHLATILGGTRRVAMEYVADNAIPYVSLVDAGTVELVRSLGPEVVSSADFAQAFEAVLSPAQIESHRVAGAALVSAGNQLLDWLRAGIASDAPLDEFTVQEHFAALMEAGGLVVDPDERPLVAVNRNAANPHYSPTPARHAPVRRGDLLLLDFSARMPGPDAVWADYTWMTYVGEQVPAPIAALFAIIRDARDAGITLLRQRFERHERVDGWEVDDTVRNVVREAGYGTAFVHRTGHNISTAIHGNGAHLDNYETHDSRPLLTNTCTSVEPGIYLPQEGLGLRTEVDVLLLPGGIEVTGIEQEAVTPLLG